MFLILVHPIKPIYTTYIVNAVTIYPIYVYINRMMHYNVRGKEYRIYAHIFPYKSINKMCRLYMHIGTLNN